MKKLKITVVVGIILLGLLLRLNNYAEYPQRGASSDEYTYTFLGMSLFTKGVPISWSAMSAYKNRKDLTIRNLYFPIVWPYFDHPPFNGFLVGGWALLNGENTFEKVQLKTIRLVPIFLGGISMILVFLLGYRLYDYKTGIWALLIYATTTIFIMNTRVVFAENLLTPILLGCIYLFIQFRNRLNVKRAVIFGVLAGIAFWTKELGITVFCTMLYLFLMERIKLKYLLWLVGVSIAIMLGYGAYGAFYDGQLFYEIVFIQSSRDIGPRTLSYLLSMPIIVNKFYFDGWYFFGLFSLLFALFDFKKHKMVVIPSMIYFLLMLFFLTQEGEMGWYMIPLFPFMAIATAALLVESLKKQSWFILVMMLFVGMYVIRYIYEANFGLVPFQFRFMLLLFFAPFLILAIFNKEKAFAWLSQFWFYTFIVANIVLSLTYIHPA